MSTFLSNLFPALTKSMALFIAKGSKGSLDTLGKGAHTLSTFAECQKLMLVNIDQSWQNGETSHANPKQNKNLTEVRQLYTGSFTASDKC